MGNEDSSSDPSLLSCLRNSKERDPSCGAKIMAEVQRLSTRTPALASLLTDEEIRAYRHHRKRLARIVADQWLYVARFRLLTLRFRKQQGEKIKRYYITQWRAVVEKRMRTCQTLERATVLCRFILERRSFQTWQVAVQTQQLIRRAFDQTVQIIQRNTRRRGLAALQAYSQEEKHRREQQLNAQVFWTFRFLRGCFTTWYYFMHQRRIRKKTLERADQKWTETLLQLTIRGWKRVLTEWDPARIGDRNNPGLQFRLLSKWFCRWNAFVSQKKAQISNTRNNKLFLAQRHHERKLLRAVYDGWDRARFSSRLAREVAQQMVEASAMDVAVSWFVKSLVKRILICWKQQAVVQINHRRNHWHAVVHFKVQMVAKGLRGFREHVELGRIKQSLQMLSVESYQQRLKRKAVTGCKLLHQSKRLKSAQLELVKAQRKTTKLQERFDQWYLATALKSMKKNQMLKSVNFSYRHLCLRGFQAWRAFRGLRIEKKRLKETRLKRLSECLSKFKKMHVLRAWKSLRKEMNIKRFNEARALQFLLGFRAAAVVRALHVHMQGQTLKRSLFAKATQFQEKQHFQRAVSTWKKFVFLRQLGHVAADHRRRVLLKRALHTLVQWKEPQQEETTQLEKSPEIVNPNRNLRSTQTPQHSPQPNTTPHKQVSTARAQPRRPAFLYNDLDQTKRTTLELRVGKQFVDSGSLASKNLQFVAREVEWMEQILLDYEDLKVQIVKLRAELALLLETRSLGESDLHPRDQMQLLQDQKTLLIQQELHSLEAKKMVQMPLIQAVLSRVQDLRINKVPT